MTRMRGAALLLVLWLIVLLTALIGAFAVVALVAASRIVLAEHWLIDAAAAVAGAIGVGLLGAAALRLTTAPPTPAN